MPGEATTENRAHCLGCGYALTGLADAFEPRCPECGRLFSWEDTTTFDGRPPFDRWRFWRPALLLAVALPALMLLALGLKALLGWPGFILGPLIGYRLRVRWTCLLAGGFFVLPLLANQIAHLVDILGWTKTLDLYATVLLSLFFVFPTSFSGGLMLGLVLRCILTQPGVRFPQKAYLQPL